MCSGDRGVDRHVPIDQLGPVGVLMETTLDEIPGAVIGQALMPLPDGLPRPEQLGQITPGDPAPVSVDDRFDHQPGVRERTPLLPCRARHDIRDQSPLIIREKLKLRHDINDPSSHPNYLTDTP